MVGPRKYDKNTERNIANLVFFSVFFPYFRGPTRGKAFSPKKGLVFAVNGASAPPPPPNSQYTPLAPSPPPSLSWKKNPPPPGIISKTPTAAPGERWAGARGWGWPGGGVPRPHLPRKRAPFSAKTPWVGDFAFFIFFRIFGILWFLVSEPGPQDHNAEFLEETRPILLTERVKVREVAVGAGFWPDQVILSKNFD